MAKDVLRNRSTTIGVLSIADIRNAVRQNTSTEDCRLAHPSMDGLPIVIAANFSTAQRLRGC